MLTGKQHCEIIKANWSLLYPLPTMERMRVLDELIEYEEQMETLREAISGVASCGIITCHSPLLSSAASP